VAFLFRAVILTLRNEGEESMLSFGSYGSKEFGHSSMVLRQEKQFIAQQKVIAARDAARGAAAYDSCSPGWSTAKNRRAGHMRRAVPCRHVESILRMDRGFIADSVVLVERFDDHAPAFFALFVRLALEVKRVMLSADSALNISCFKSGQAKNLHVSISFKNDGVLTSRAVSFLWMRRKKEINC
jgi:hypothetical protein